MTPETMVTAIRARGADATLEDLPACPGSQSSWPSVPIPGGILAVGRQSDEWPVLGEDLGDALHVQTECTTDHEHTGRFCLYDAEFRAWDCNAREAVSILATFGARIPDYQCDHARGWWPCGADPAKCNER